MSTLDGGERCYNNMSRLVDQWDGSCHDYEMIRNMECDISSGAQSCVEVDVSKGVRRTQCCSSEDDIYPLFESMKLSGNSRRLSIHRSRKVRYYCNVLPLQPVHEEGGNSHKDETSYKDEDGASYKDEDAANCQEDYNYGQRILP